MNVPRRRFLAAAGAGLAAAAGCAAPTSDAGGRGDAATNESLDASESDAADAAADEPFAALYDAVIPSIVRIRGYGPSGPLGEGSGWVWTEGTLVTNAHVVANAETVRVPFYEGEWRVADLLGTDAYSDLAALSVANRPDYARPLSFVDDQPPVGTRVAALGAPFGLGGSLSAGVVSGQDRSVRTVSEFSVADAVQTDAALNPGNSGGPLVTLDGDVAGVVSQAGGENVGFAVSAALAERVVPTLVEDGAYDHPFLGVMIREVTPLLAEANDLRAARGVYVADTTSDGPAASALRGSSGEERVDGVRVPTGGAGLVRLGERRVDTIAELGTYLALETSPGDELAVGVWRDGEEQTVTLTLGRRPAPPS